MEKSLFRFIWRFSARQQGLILLVTLLSYPVSYILLELPKLIVNDAIQRKDFPRDVWDFEFNQTSYLFLLCLSFLGLVVLSNGIKFFLNVYKGRLSERMLRRLRFELFQRVLRFRLPHFRKVSSGEIIPMITSEVEDVGGFVGEAFALPAYQGGLLIVQLFFIFMQDPLLGLAAICTYPLQGYVIPKLQRRVVLLSRERVKNIRVISDKIGESIAGIEQIHADDASAWHSADIGNRLYENFRIRYEIYNRKYFIKFLNNFMNQLTPFFFYLIGGYLVIEGDLSLGALLAVIAAYKDLAAPWKELLAYYQMVADVDVKYQTVVENFDLPDVYPVERLTADDIEELSGPLRMINVTFSGGAAGQEVTDVSLEVADGCACAVVGPDGSGRAEVLQLAAGLVSPASGKVELGGKDLEGLNEATLGRQIAYVGGSIHIWTGTIRDNLYYGLRHRPVSDVEREGREAQEYKRALREAELTGNPSYDVTAAWDDLKATGVETLEELDRKALKHLKLASLDSDIYRLGMQSRFEPSKDGEFVDRILEVRAELAERIASDRHISQLVEFWRLDTFNVSASLAENLLFAVPADASISMDDVVDMPEVRDFLARNGLEEPLLSLGVNIAETMLDLFANVSDSSGLRGTYSFISEDELPEFERIVRVSRAGNLVDLSPNDKARLASVALKLVPARHRLGVLDDAMKEQIVAARKLFHEQVVEKCSAFVAFDPQVYLPPLSIEDNLLFGRPRLDRRDARKRIDAFLSSVVEEKGLREPIILAGFDYHVGVAGSRLSAHQRRRLSVVRALLKNAKVTILDDVASGNTEEEKQTRRTLRKLLKGSIFLFGAESLEVAKEFEHAVIMDQGQAVETHGDGK